MDDQALRTCICETGRELLENGLVARTWGNVSARADGGHYLVTPSGMDYGSIAPRSGDRQMDRPAQAVRRTGGARARLFDV